MKAPLTQRAQAVPNFRFEDGKIVEHWDNLQETAKSSKDYRWFFDVYLYRAALPRLVAIHEGSTLKLRWQAPDDLPFPMPVDVRVNGRIVTLPMLDGTGMTPADATATITIDPLSKILMQSDAIDRYQQWEAAQPAKETPP